MGKVQEQLTDILLYTTPDLMKHEGSVWQHCRAVSRSSRVQPHAHGFFSALKGWGVLVFLTLSNHFQHTIINNIEPVHSSGMHFIVTLLH